VPDNSLLIIRKLVVTAQHERKTISIRTKDALAANLKRQELLVNLLNLTVARRAAGREVLMMNARNAISISSKVNLWT